MLYACCKISFFIVHTTLVGSNPNRIEFEFAFAFAEIQFLKTASRRHLAAFLAAPPRAPGVMPPAAASKRKAKPLAATSPSSVKKNAKTTAPAASNDDASALSVQQQCFLQALLSRGIVESEDAEALYRCGRVTHARFRR